MPKHVWSSPEACLRRLRQPNKDLFLSLSLASSFLVLPEEERSQLDRTGTVNTTVALLSTDSQSVATN